MGHLEIEDDLDLDEDILGLNLGINEPVISASIAPSFLPAPTVKQFQPSDFSRDASQALFFPLAPDDRGAQRSKIKDPFDAAKEKGWDWRTFYRTETDEEIKKRWEEAKGDLTKDWKRRHREALKSRKRRGGAGADDRE